MKILLFLVAALGAQLSAYAQQLSPDKPLRVGIAGLTHGHVHWILRAVAAGEVELAGIAEANNELAGRLMKQYKIPSSLLFSNLGEMLDKTRPEAVTAFGSIYDHLAVVEACAPRKIHVMVEKPLAVSLEHARQMQDLARAHKIQLLTNYETTWYGTNHKAYQMINEGILGGIVKVVVRDGHQGPREIGVNPEFLEWLTDPVLNGGGALTDFGCYGANLITWLMKGQRPIKVMAVTQQLKPDVYPRVDDEATIILTYPRAQGIIQASWNWPYNRKDMEVYGRNGSLFADRTQLRHRHSQSEDIVEEVPQRHAPFDDPFRFLTAVVRGNITLEENDLSALQVNMIAMEILEAAKRSASTGEAVLVEKR